MLKTRKKKIYTCWEGVGWLKVRKIKEPEAKLDDLNPVPQTHIVEGENWVPKVVL